MAGKSFRYHKAAEAELEQAAAWYEEQREGLGREFLAAVAAKVGQIVSAPERWPAVGRSRRALVGDFRTRWCTDCCRTARSRSWRSHTNGAGPGTGAGAEIPRAL